LGFEGFDIEARFDHFDCEVERDRLAVAPVFFGAVEQRIVTHWFRETVSACSRSAAQIAELGTTNVKPV
jgi:hypothetical protein